MLIRDKGRGKEICNEICLALRQLAHIWNAIIIN